MNNNISFINPNEVRRTVLQMLHRAGASHLGSNMSAIEMLIAMYESVDVERIRCGADDRDRIVISKGHCAAATYAVMGHFGILPMVELQNYHMDGSFLAGHVSHAVPSVEHSTGALGHGINVAVGCAIGLRAQGFPERLVLTLVGDGEIQEGSVWEAVMLSSHLKLDNLIILVDNNSISSITATERVIDMRPLTSRFKGFGCGVLEVDGHDVLAISSAVSELHGKGRPGVIICNTIKGRDVPFAEGDPVWHYRSLSDELYAEALNHLNTKDVSEKVL
ncbi:transketolase [Alphaproteobacteria bacterium]|nr:transketolase [Alphaproteobacteria bacterium]